MKSESRAADGEAVGGACMQTILLGGLQLEKSHSQKCSVKIAEFRAKSALSRSQAFAAGAKVVTALGCIQVSRKRRGVGRQ